MLTLVSVALVTQVCGQGLSPGMEVNQAALQLDRSAWRLLQDVLKVHKCEVACPDTHGGFSVHCWGPGRIPWNIYHQRGGGAGRALSFQLGAKTQSSSAETFL